MYVAKEICVYAGRRFVYVDVCRCSKEIYVCVVKEICVCVCVYVGRYQIKWNLKVVIQV